MSCKHLWDEVRRTYSPPPTNLKQVNGATEDLFREMAFGVTTVELRCGRCGDVTGRTLIGRSLPPG